MRTVEQWFLELDVPESISAHNYAEKRGTLNDKYNSLSQAIHAGFIWSETAEGHEYWSNIFINQLRKESQTIKEE